MGKVEKKPLGSWGQIGLLIWKNVTLTKRRPLVTAIEIILPAFFFIVFVSIRSAVHSKDKVDETFCSQQVAFWDYPRFSESRLRNAAGISDSIPVTNEMCEELALSNFANYTAIGFAPNTSEVIAIMDNVKTVLDRYSSTHSSFPLLNYVGFASPADLETLPQDPTEKYFLGLAFYQDDAGGLGAPGISGNKVHYVFRFLDGLADNDGWQTDRTYPQYPNIDPEFLQVYMTPDRLVGFQTLVEMSIVGYLNGSSSIPYVYPRLKPHPYPSYTSDPFISSIKFMLPLLLVLAFIYTFMIMVKDIVYEKEMRLKEAMKMMGLKTWVLWVSWFVKHFFFLMISCIIITALMAGGTVVRYSNAGMIFVFLMLYILSIICFAYFISTLFDTSSLAAASGGLIYFLSYVPTLYIQRDYASVTYVQKSLACLLPATCAAIGANNIGSLEQSGKGLTSASLGDNPSLDDSFTMAAVFGFLILDCFIYVILTWQIEAIFPGRYGISKGYFFWLRRDYWLDTVDDDEEISMHHELSKDDLTNPDIERDESDAEKGIIIKHLSKIYKGVGGEKIAVDNLSLDMNKGEVNVLLGHNGAGKTTTMNILCGVYPPSSGTAIIGGYDIRKDITKVQRSLGLCPQFSVLWATLTVQEHLYFFSKLKGLSDEEIKEESAVMLSDVDLEDKKSSRAGTLSGGQKRGLSVALAFLGGSKVVVLDEPTSGMDPYKRRHTWELILKYKEGRTIILCTHFMDEADLLGDRIAIMAQGRVRCSGTPSFLKARFGVGYHLTIDKTPECDVQGLQNFLQNEFQAPIMKTSDVGSEAVFLLPRDLAPNFGKAFRALDRSKNTMGVSAYGLSSTTMEEVFLKVGHGEAYHSKSSKDLGEEHHDDGTHLTMQMDENPDPRHGLLTGVPLMVSQFRSMFTKRLITSRRNKKALIGQLLLPAIFAILALVVALNNTALDNQKIRNMEMSNYKRAWSRYSTHDTTSDYYLGASGAVADYYQRIGGQTPYSDTKRMGAALQTYFQNDARSDTTETFNATDLSMKDTLLQASKNFVYNDYFYDAVASYSFENGPIQVQFNEISGNCEYRTEAGLFTAMTLEVAVNGTYGLHNVAGGSLSLSTSSSSQSTPTLTSYINAYNYMQWIISQDDFTSTPNLFLFCDSTQTTGSPVTILSAGSPDSGLHSINAYAWYSLVPLHGTAESLTVLSNAVAKFYLGPDAAIYSYNHPLPKVAADKVDDLRSSETAFNLALMMIFAGGFLISSFVIFLVQERISKAKHVQVVSGVGVFLFWFANYAWDMVFIILPSLLVTILFAIFNVPAFRGENLPVVFFLMMMFGFGGLPLVYLLSLLFSTVATAFARLCMLFIFVGMGLLIAVFVMELPGIDLGYIAEPLKYASYGFIPNYAMAQGILDLFMNYNYHDVCYASELSYQQCVFKDTIPRAKFSLSFPGIGANILLLFCSGVFYFTVLVLVEYGIIHRPGPKKPTGFDPSGEDNDVSAERARCQNDTHNDILTVRDLTRVYKKEGKDFIAVNHLTWGIPAGECFGLLGVNGAGKTTTFQMLTGEIPMTEGTAVFGGFDMATHFDKVRQLIGYCPQFDGIVDLMTGREILTMYSRLRGVPETSIHGVVQSLIDRMDLSAHADRVATLYSGGNKRKLCTAVALVGNPAVVFLDEPTTGMDPEARRKLWNVLLDVVKNGQSIVLTSHSLEECDALCQRLAIMVNGKFKCLGTTQHLKHKFGTGYTLMLKPLKHSSHAVHDIKAFVNENFPGNVLKEEHNQELVYDIPTSSSGLGDMFDLLEQAQGSVPIKEYSLSQTTLEQVFLTFASEQHDEDRSEMVERRAKKSSSIAPPPGTHFVRPGAPSPFRPQVIKEDDENGNTIRNPDEIVVLPSI